MRMWRGGGEDSIGRLSKQLRHVRQLKRQQLLQLQELRHGREEAASHTQQLLRPKSWHEPAAERATELVAPVPAVPAPEQIMRPYLLSHVRPLCGVRNGRRQPRDWRAVVT